MCSVSRSLCQQRKEQPTRFWGQAGPGAGPGHSMNPEASLSVSHADLLVTPWKIRIEAVLVLVTLYAVLALANRELDTTVRVPYTAHALAVLTTDGLGQAAVIVDDTLDTLPAVQIAEGLSSTAVFVIQTGRMALVAPAADLARRAVIIHDAFATLAISQVTDRVGRGTVTVVGALDALGPGQVADRMATSAVRLCNAPETYAALQIADWFPVVAIAITRADDLALVIPGKAGSARTAVHAAAALLAFA